MQIVLLDSFYTGSHKQWAIDLTQNSKHQITIFSMKGIHWKWRMHGGAITLSQQLNESKIIPDLGFFTLLLNENTKYISLLIIILALALTISTVDTLINAISSLVILDGKAVFNLSKKTNYLNFSKYIILFLSFISFIIASKGFDILYLFLLADLFCCAFVLTVFLSFYDKSINENLAYISILIGLIGGFLLFPSPDFSKSLLIGIFIPKDLFPSLVSQSLLFLSFIVATFLPLLILKAKKLHIS